MSMQFGIFGGASRGRNTDDSRGYLESLELCMEAEQLGFYGVSLVEHHFTGFGQVSSSLSFLNYLAAKTSVFRLGTAVTILPFRNPVLLAEEACTLDLLSNGRLDFGIGKGYRLNEFRGMGIPLDEAAERFEEGVAVLQKAFNNEGRWDHEGKFWKFNDVVIEPTPVQRPPALWIGASSAPSIRRAAHGGFKLLLDQAGSFELTAERVRTYREALEGSGGVWNPDDVVVTRSLMITEVKDDAWLELVASREKVRQLLRELAFAPDDPRLARPEDLPTGDLLYSDVRLSTEQSSIMGTPDECIEKLKFLEEHGVRRVQFAPTGIGALRLFAKEVMPAFA